MPHSKASAGVETVVVSPYYALEAPPMPETLGYRVVVVSEQAGKCPDADAARPWAGKSLSKTDWSRPEIEEREIQRVFDEARLEIRRLRRPGPRRWPREQNAFECLFYPVRVAGHILGLALIWAIFGPLLINIVPTPNTYIEGWLVGMPFLLVLGLALLGLTWNFLRQVLRLAALGDNQRSPVTFRDVPAILRGGVMAAGTFLAGPIFLLAGALWFWIHAGDLEWFDYLLIWQLGACAAVAWAYLLVAVDSRGRLRDAQAMAVVGLIQRQGRPALLFPLVGGVTFTLFVFLLFQVSLFLLEVGVLGCIPLFFLWCVGLFTWTFLMRWYGMTRYWQRNPA